VIDSRPHSSDLNNLLELHSGTLEDRLRAYAREAL
jgi:hypothetical protein